MQIACEAEESKLSARKLTASLFSDQERSIQTSVREHIYCTMNCKK